MAKASNQLEELNDSKPNPQNSGTQASIDAPAIVGDDTKRLDLEAKSVKTVTHAVDICTATEVANRHRAKRCADIQSWYDGAPPRSISDKMSKAMGWESNFSTRWLAGMVDPAVLRAVGAVNGQIYVTNSSLPHNRPDWKMKSDQFKSTTSRLFRSWDGWSVFLQNLAQENFLHGYAYSVFLDPVTWKPTFFKQDRTFTHEEATQDPKDMQFLVVKQDYMLHDFIELFHDESIAADAGYHLENCVEAANKATVQNPRDDAATTEFRRFSDMIAEGTLGLSYTKAGARIVKVWLLWNREYDGSVSFWMIDRDTRKLLRYVNKMYKSMEDTVKLFALETGNGHLVSSKGIGRKLIGMAMAIEDGRNKALDASRMGGMLLLKVDANDRQKLQPVISSPFVVFDKNIEIDQHRFQTNADEFLKLDSMLSGYAQQTAGSYVSAMIQPNGKERTATEASIDSTREQEHGDAVRSRWIEQFSKLVGQMQERAYSDETLTQANAVFEQIVNGTYKPQEGQEVQPELVATLELLQAGLTVDDIKFLRHAPASGLISVEDAYSTAGIQKLAATYTGNPMIDQVELLKRTVESIAGPEAAKTLIIPGIDQTILAEAARIQISEATSMLVLGVPTPVSPRDNNLVHAQTLRMIMQQSFPALQNDPTGANQKLLKGLELGINHMADHMAALKASGAADPAIADLTTWYNQFTNDFKKAVAIQSQTRTETQITQQIGAAQQAQQGQEGAQQGQPGQPGQEPAAPVIMTPEERRRIAAEIAKGGQRDSDRLAAVKLDTELEIGSAPALPDELAEPEIQPKPGILSGEQL